MQCNHCRESHEPALNGLCYRCADVLTRQRDQLLAQVQAMTPLLQEMVEWHSHPESAGYNACDRGMCLWCELAQLALAGQIISVQSPTAERLERVDPQ